VDSGELAAGQDQSSAFMFAYVDKVSDVLVEEFGNERERMVRGRAVPRRDNARDFGRRAVDEEVASSRLGYELRRTNVAIRVSSGASAVPRTWNVRFVKPRRSSWRGSARRRVGCRSVSMYGRGSYDRPTTDGSRLRAAARRPVAFGRPAAGIAGFRSSHAEALQPRACARWRPARGPR